MRACRDLPTLASKMNNPETAIPCWICGQPATTGEHRFKASDLRSTFPKTSQSEPLRLNSAIIKNRRVGSVRSDILKFPNSLCHDCNTTRTQPYDRAWELLSSELRNNPVRKAGTLLRTNRLWYDARR